MHLDPNLVASEWLAAFSEAVQSAHPRRVAETFLENGWFRDILVFTWDIRTLAGQEKITAYLAGTLANSGISDVKVDEDPLLVPRTFDVPTTQTLGVEVAFTFECAHGHGRANARLVPDAAGTYKAMTLMTELRDLPGHEELGTLPLRDDITGIPGRDMQDEFTSWVREVETKPYVLIGTVQTYRPGGAFLTRWMMPQWAAARRLSRLRHGSSRWTFLHWSLSAMRASAIAGGNDTHR